ncbi:hypothetical protein K701_13425 [Streptomyces fradiae ATCC 10745 = DSM 40063]|uniref:Uncharacterized protein n=1 Tax=Streptomyces fradiae ATCC 10745 = DSM 40063 TaxID=1319510 RepID=A0ABQ6XUC5_STRFR|nr:hypothetical protein K701_13425 [Streptomyces fradiae ATCC 10745 = DSM 40063]
MGCPAATGGVGEEEVLLGVFAGQDGLDGVLDGEACDLVDSGASGGSRAREDELAYKVGFFCRDDLGDEAAHRQAEQVDPVVSEGQMKSTVSRAIASIVSGVEPPDAPTPRLSMVITGRRAASPSTTRGPQLSRTADRWLRRIRGMPSSGPSRR